MSQIHANRIFLVFILYMRRVSPHFHVEFYPSFTTINGCNGNIVSPSYWQAMCEFIKIRKPVFVHSDQNDPSSTFISPSDQDQNTSENSP